MSARSGLVGKKSSWPYLEPSRAIFSMDRKNQKKNAKILLIFPWWALAAIHPWWGYWYPILKRLWPLLLSEGSSVGGGVGGGGVWKSGNLSSTYREPIVISRFPDISNLAWVGPGLVAVLCWGAAAGGGRPSTALPRAHPRPKPGPTQARFEISGNLEIQKF